jgi:hypothetical protein
MPLRTLTLLAFNKGILRAPKVKGQGAKRPVLKAKFKSRLEERIATQLEAAGINPMYETAVLRYVVPPRNARYTPDFPIGPKPIYIEAKGYFRSPAERSKMIHSRDQNPGVDIRLVFQKAHNPIYKGSPTTNAMWAETNGFPWADHGVIPEAWLDEARAIPAA